MVAKAPQRRTPKLGCDADYALEQYTTQAPTHMLIGTFPHDAAQKILLLIQVPPDALLLKRLWKRAQVDAFAFT